MGAAFEPQERAPLMAPSHSSFRCLFFSLLEPNVLILLAYLAFNLHLALKVIRIATRSYATSTLMASPNDSTAAPEHDLAVDDDDEADGRRSDTRATELLVGLSAWAFNNDARNAKRITALLAVASLASTWTYMFAYLQYSYEAYISRCHLTSYPLPPAPPPLSWDHADLIVPSLHLRVLRISQWLSSLSLFEEAWMEVVRDRNAWFWSSEICIVTVGSWAVFLRSESKRLKIPHVWTFMALGQLVAISFAYNLFQLAVLFRLDAADLIPGSSRSGTVKRTVIIQAAEAPPRRSLARTESEMLMPPPSSPPPGSASTASGATAAVTATTTTVQRIPLSPRPSLSDRFGALMAKILPERIGIPLFLLGGLWSVFSGPDTLGKVLVMHAFPMLAVLYPIRRTSTRKLKSSAAFGHPLATPGDKAAATRYVRSKRKVPFYLDRKLVHLTLAASSIALRLRTVYGVWIDVRGEYDVPVSLAQRLWQSATNLYPQTFHRHPAVSSIGSDHVAVLASVVAFVLIESGLWIWKDAKTSPSARQVPASATASVTTRLFSERPEMISLTPTTVTLDALDRSRLEFQSRFVLLIAALAPVWGASASLGFYLALRETWIEDDEHFSQQQQRQRHRAGRESVAGDAADGGGGELDVEKEKVVGRLLETDEGERVLEIRQRKVSVAAAAVSGGASDAGLESDEGSSVSGAEALSSPTAKTGAKRGRKPRTTSSRKSGAAGSQV